MEDKDKLIVEQQKKIADQAQIISAQEQEIALLTDDIERMKIVKENEKHIFIA